MAEQEQRPKFVLPKPGRLQVVKGYGIDQTDLEGMLPWNWVSERMDQSRNYWIGTTRPDGRPHAAPVWGVWLDETFYFSTGRLSRKGRNLAANPQVVVHLESGDEVIIFEGRVEVLTDRRLFEPMAEAYGVKYPGFKPEFDSNPLDALYYILRPGVVYAWLESDFLKSATRWQFD